MSRARELWQANQDLAAACLDHPFMRSLADGRLARSIFMGYVAQDAFFLDAFARAYCVAAAKAPDAAGFRAFLALAAGVLHELRLHAGYAATWEIDVTNQTPLSATRRYCDFVLATA